MHSGPYLLVIIKTQLRPNHWADTINKQHLRPNFCPETITKPQLRPDLQHTWGPCSPLFSLQCMYGSCFLCSVCSLYETSALSLLSLQCMYGYCFLFPVCSLYEDLPISLLCVQTLFFNHQSLDLTLADLCKSEPIVSPDMPMGQLWAASSLVLKHKVVITLGTFGLSIVCKKPLYS